MKAVRVLSKERHDALMKIRSDESYAPRADYCEVIMASMEERKAMREYLMAQGACVSIAGGMVSFYFQPEVSS